VSTGHSPEEPAAVAVACSAVPICITEDGQLGRNMKFVHKFTVKRRKLHVDGKSVPNSGSAQCNRMLFSLFAHNNRETGFLFEMDDIASKLLLPV
jgi:hypothetical protein